MTPRSPYADCCAEPLVRKVYEWQDAHGEQHRSWALSMDVEPCEVFHPLAEAGMRVVSVGDDF